MPKRKRSSWKQCPACREVKENFTGGVGAGNSYSRYADVYICSECGLREAFELFFWRAWCPDRAIKPHHREPSQDKQV